MVARQRGRLRRQPRRPGRLDPPRRSEPTAALRGRRSSTTAGSTVGVPPPTWCVRCIRRSIDRAYGRLRRRSPVHHVRVQPRDGQLERLARRLLGRDHAARPACRVASSGSGRITVCSPRCRTASEGFAYGGQFGERSARRQLRRRWADVVRPACRTRRCRRSSGSTARSSSSSTAAPNCVVIQPAQLHRPRRPRRATGS